MATKAVVTTYSTGLTLYWYPISRSLADWATYRIAATEDVAPNTGRYQATLDTANCDTVVDPDCVFLLFVGASQPSSFDTAVQAVSALTSDTSGLPDISAEIAKIPRAASALTPGGNITRSKQSATSDTLVERLS